MSLPVFRDRKLERNTPHVMSTATVMSNNFQLLEPETSLKATIMLASHFNSCAMAAICSTRSW